jgi:hypothetical protein
MAVSTISDQRFRKLLDNLHQCEVYRAMGDLYEGRATLVFRPPVSRFIENGPEGEEKCLALREVINLALRRQLGGQNLTPSDFGPLREGWCLSCLKSTGCNRRSASMRIS